MLKRFLFILWVGIFPCAGFATECGVDEIVHEVLEKFDVPGIAVGVIANHQVIVSRGYGLRNVEKNLPVTDKTLFPIASCTKAFTCLLLGQLVEEGRISWDDPVITYIPEFRLFTEQLSNAVTIRDLVTHRTGVPRHDAIWFCRTISQAEMINCLQYLEPICKLRENWHYNNFMYAIAGLVIERVTQKSYQEVLESRIFAPLKMFDSNVSIEELKKTSDFSLPYGSIARVVKNLPFHALDPVEPAGAINSNIIDMLKWAQLHLAPDSTINRVIQRETLEEMHALQIPITDEREMGLSFSGYGLGWFIGTYKDFAIVGHQGSMDGFNSEVLLVPQKGIAIVILCNSSSDGHYAINAVRNTLLDNLLEIDQTDWVELTQKKWEKAQEALQIEEHKEIKEPTYVIHRFAQDYQNPAYGKVRIYSAQSKLFAAYGESIIPLNHASGMTFKGQVHELLYFGINRLIDFTFSDNFKEVDITFDASGPPLKFIAEKRL